MNHYELLFILPGTLDENETKPLVDKVRNIIEKNDGKNLTVGELDKRRLAYPMKHIRYGYFGLAYFEAEPAMVKKMEADFILDRIFLRVFVKKINPNVHTLKQINFGQVPTVNTEAVGYKKTQEEEFATIKKVEEVPEVTEVAEETPVVIEEKEVVEEKKKTTKKVAKKEEKVNLDDIDKKLDEILDIDLNKV